MTSGQLPSYGLIIPNNAHNGHDSTLLAADQWWQANIAPLINDPQFQKDGLLFILFDEGRSTDTAYGGGHIVGVAVGPWVKPAYRSGSFAQQQNILKTVCDLLSIGSFAAPSVATETAASVAECLVEGAAAPSPTRSASPSPSPSASPADLRVTVNDGKTSIIAGAQDTYTIVVSNAGPAGVTGAAVTDTFPSIFTGVTYTAAESGGVTGFTASGTGDINNTLDMPSGSKITYTVKGKLSSAATGTLSNAVAVALPADVTDPNLSNNSATDSDTMRLKADLRVMVRDGKTSLAAGIKNTYTVTVTNVGPSDVSGAVIQETFPATFTDVIYTASQTGGATGFTANGSGDIKDTLKMPAAAKVIYKATGTVSASATGSISTTATVSSPTGVPDPNSANNSATDTDTL